MRRPYAGASRGFGRPRRAWQDASHGRSLDCSHPRERAQSRLRPRQRRASRAGAEAGRAAEGRGRADGHGRRHPPDGEGRGARRRPAAQPPEPARRHAGSDGRRRQGRDQGRGRGRTGVAGDVVRGPRVDHPQGGRPAGRPMAFDHQRRHDARSVEDRVAGGDRLGVRADRLLAVQRALRTSRSCGSSRSPTARASGTGPTTGPSKVSSTPSRRSTSRPSPATCPPRRR